MSTNTQTAEKFIVIPYRKNRRNLTAAEMRPAQTEESAKRIACPIAERFAGVVMRYESSRLNWMNHIQTQHLKNTARSKSLSAK